MNVVIVEDNQKDASLIKSYLEKFAKEKQIDIVVNEFLNPILFLEQYSLTYDIVFMDIHMPIMNGLECAKKLRVIDKNVVLIFITNLAQYAVNGYEVNALDFIVKPISYYNFSLKTQRALKYLEDNHDVKIKIKTLNGIAVLSIKEILYIEIFNHSLVFYTNDNNFIESNGQLLEIENELLSYDFFRCSRNYLVNLRYVRSINDNFVFIGDKKLEISRRRKKSFIEALASYLKKLRGL